MEIKKDTWTASIADLSYPLTLSRLSGLDVLEVIPLARFSADGGPGIGPGGGISREGGCESDDCDAFDGPLMSASPSTITVLCPYNWPTHGFVMGVGAGGAWVLFSFLTYVTHMG